MCQYWDNVRQNCSVSALGQGETGLNCVSIGTRGGRSVGCQHWDKVRQECSVLALGQVRQEARVSALAQGEVGG